MSASVNIASTPSRPDRFEAVQTARKFFLDHLAELLRDSRLISESAVSAIVLGSGNYYDAMISKRRQGSFKEEVRGLTSSRISLVGDDDLELDIRLDNLCNRLAQGTSVPLWKTHLRFATLLSRPDLPKNDNPVGPRGITEGLNSLFKAAGASSLDKKLELLDRIEVALLTGLPGIYSQLDELLQEIGVETATPPIASTQSSPPATASKPETRPEAVPLGGGEARTIPAGSVLLSQAALDNLMFRLDQMERTRHNSTDFLTATSPKLEALIPELFADAGTPAETPPPVLQSDALGIPANSFEGRAIDLTGRFCETLFKDTSLPAVLREAVAKLQIRIAKLAIRDRTLFARADNPCRLLIDRMGALLIGLPANAPATDPRCRIVGEISERLRQEPDADAAAFANAAGELEALIEARRQQAIEAAAPYLPFLRQLDRREQADREIADYYARLHLQALPELLRNFIVQDWKRLLERAWFEQGPDSPAWRERTETLNALIWSFQPKADGDQRRALAQKLPAVLQAIKEGMEVLNLPAETQTHILDACFELQTRAMRPANGNSSLTPASMAIGTTEAHHGISQQSVGRLEAGNRVLHTIDYLLPPGGDSRGADFTNGTWMELQLDGVPQVLCLCQQSTATGRCLFFNPETDLAVAIHPLLLAEQLRKGAARNLEQPGLSATLLARISAP